MTDNLQDPNATDDTTQGSETTTPSAKQGAQQTNEPTFTQADIDRIVEDRLKRERQTNDAKLKERYGVDDLSEVDTLLEAHRKRKEAEMSEVEKAQALAEKANEALKAEQDKVTALQNQLLDTKRDNGLLALLNEAHDKNKVLNLLKIEKPETIQSLLNEGGVFDEDAAKKLIADYQQENGYLFKSSNPGSQSNAGGRPPNPSSKQLEEVRKELHKKFGKL